MIWKRPLQKHCSDDLLLGHLDGELSLRADALVKKHLKACWECRARLAEIEEQAQAVAKALANPLFPGPDRMAGARRRFSAWQERLEQNLEPVPQLTLLPTASRRAWIAVATGLLVCLAALGTWAFPRLRSPQPFEVLAGVRQFESSVHQVALPVHQSFRVQISEIKPVERRRRSRLDVWSEPDGGRFASQWRDDGGRLEYAVWRPRQGQEFAYDPGMAPGVVSVAERRAKAVSLAQLSPEGLGVDQIEAGFLRWLQGRRWRPIAFASDLAVFLDEDGVMLRAERIRSEEGEPAIRLSAQRANARLRVEMVLEVDIRTYRPRLERIRFTDGDREVELCLAVERDEAVPLQRLTPTVFQPDATLAAPVVRAAVPRSGAIARPPSTPTVAEAHTDPAALETAEIDAYYVLHRAGACLGEPIEVARDAAGYIQVRGLATAPERKAELLNSLAQLKSASWVRVDLRTVEEAAVEVLSPAVPTRQVTHTSASALPIQDQLERFFRDRGDPKNGGRGRQITELTNEAASASDKALAHAWALRRLAERYGGKQEALLRPQSRWLLEAMLRDHLTALRARSDRTQRLLEPVLALVAGESMPPTAGEDSSDLTWSAGALAVFDTIQKMDGLVQALFAGAGLNGKPVDLAAGELRGAFTRLDSNVRALEAQLVGKEFRPEMLSSAQRPD